MKNRLILLATAAAVCLCAQLLPAQNSGKNRAAEQPAFKVTQLADVTVTPGALTVEGIYGNSINAQSFQQELLLSLNGYQYTTFYDKDKRVCVARRNLRNDNVEVLTLPDYTFRGRDDAHNIISLGICRRDGTLHISFDHHNDSLKYRRSVPGLATDPKKFAWTADLFGPIQSKLTPVTSNRVCYPRFIHHPDGSLQFAYRTGGSGNGDCWLADYNDREGSWQNEHQIDSRRGTFTDELGSNGQRNAYKNGYTYDKDGILHATFVWRESPQGSNHDLNYVWSPDRGDTWLNNAGEVVGTADGRRIVELASPGIKVWNITRKQSLMNQQTQNVDSENQIHAVMWHQKDGVPFDGTVWTPHLSSYFHYWRDAGGEWHRNEIPSPVGGRPKLFFDKNDNAILIYNVPNAEGETEIHRSNCMLVIAAATKAAGWKDWTVVYRDRGPYLNEMQADPLRFAGEGILSVFVQQTPGGSRIPSTIRILDFRIVPQK